MSLRFAFSKGIAIIGLAAAIGPLTVAGQRDPGFIEYLASRRPQLEEFCRVETNAISRRVFTEYGAMFAANDPVKLPDRCVFLDELDVEDFQATLKIRTAIIRGTTIELQDAAMVSLLAAIDEANRSNLRITPLDGSIAGRRSYADTVRIWNSRFLPALNYWVRRGKISASDADAARSLDKISQAEQVMEWESSGWFFSTNFSRSIFSSTAPPGTSQHLSLVAFDVVEYGNKRVRNILNKHGWFQTVASDSPHFTYLGVAETALPSRGLKPLTRGGYKYWVPKLD